MAVRHRCPLPRAISSAIALPIPVPPVTGPPSHPAASSRLPALTDPAGEFADTLSPAAHEASRVCRSAAFRPLPETRPEGRTPANVRAIHRIRPWNSEGANCRRAARAASPRPIPQPRRGCERENAVGPGFRPACGGTPPRRRASWGTAAGRPGRHGRPEGRPHNPFTAPERAGSSSLALQLSLPPPKSSLQAARPPGFGDGRRIAGGGKQACVITNDGSSSHSAGFTLPQAVPGIPRARRKSVVRAAFRAIQRGDWKGTRSRPSRRRLHHGKQQANLFMRKSFAGGVLKPEEKPSETPILHAAVRGGRGWLDFRAASSWRHAEPIRAPVRRSAAARSP